jgi:RNA polymerase sigma-70 factor (ECF subfamily)
VQVAGVSFEAAATAATPSRPSDGQLLERAARGDVDAFDELLVARLDRLFRMAVAITRSEADARDAVQDASVLAWRQLPTLRERGRFDAWLSKILVNACRAILRRQSRVRRHESEMDPTEPGAAGDSAFAIPAAADSLGEIQAIQHAFKRLDPTSRALIVLHYVEGRPLAEIARDLGSPVGTVKWRLSNARRALDRALEVERR